MRFQESTTVSDIPDTWLLHGLFELQSRRQPDAVAFRLGRATITYSELDQQACRLASHLRSLGMGGSSRVAVYMPRSFETVVSLLATLKIGGCCVPLDPDDPATRHADILDVADAHALLTLDTLVPRLPSLNANVKVVVTDTFDGAEVDTDDDGPAVSVDDLAFLFFTSGSTGRPKGVMLTHRALASGQRWLQETFALPRGTRQLWRSSISVTNVIREVFWPATAGGESVIVPPGDHNDLAVHARLISEEQVGVVFFVPAMLEPLLEMPEFVGTESLRYVFCSSDVMPAELQHRYSQSGMQAELYNIYGLTEALYATYWECTGDTFGKTVPIGKSAELTAYLLDEQMRPIKEGEGELYLGGVGIMQGYWQLADLTNEKLVPDPFRHSQDARLFRTGDRACYLKNGAIQLLGRADHQVKVRGYRVELGEVEGVLQQHPRLSGGVVAFRQDLAQGSGLVAYYVPQRGADVTVSSLREFIAQRLPEYMVPAAFVCLEQLPKTASGKVDRASLPAPERTRPALSSDFIAPRSPLEDSLLQLWQDVLGVSGLGVHDDYFEVGGDSILSFQISARAMRRGIPLRPDQMFRHPTIARLAEEVTKLAPDAAEQTEFPLSAFQRQFFARNAGDPPRHGRSLVLRSRSKLDVEALEEALRRMIGAHAGLSTRFRASADCWKQVLEGESPVASLKQFELEGTGDDQFYQQCQDIAGHLADALSVTAGVMVQAALATNADAEFVIVVLHQLVADGTSCRVFLQDLRDCYDSRLRGEAAQIEPESTTYRNYVDGIAALPNQPTAASESPTESDRRAWSPTESSDPAAPPQTVVSQFSESQTAAFLGDANLPFRTQPDEFLTAAVVRALNQQSTNALFHVNLTSGRSHLWSADGDLARTIGGAPAVASVWVTAEALGSPAAALTAVKDQIRRARGQASASDLAAPVNVEWLGEIDSPGQAESALALEWQSVLNSDQLANHNGTLEIEAVVLAGQLRVRWRSPAGGEQVTKLARDFEAALTELCGYCLDDSVAGVFTEADLQPFSWLVEHKDDVIASARMQPGAESLAVRDIEDIYPCTPLQQGLVFHTLYAPESAVYFEQFTYRLRGELEIEAFKQAWHDLVHAHPILKTAISWQLEQPLQVVHRRVDVPWDERDWSSLTAEGQQAELDELMADDLKRSFNLAIAPIMRFTLIRTSPQDHYLMWSFHHVILDAWSASLLVDEAMQRYEALLAGRTIHYPRARPYRHYVARFEGRSLDKAESFWRHELAGFEVPTITAINRPIIDRPAVGNIYDKRRILLTEDETSALLDQGRRHQLTLNTLVQAAFSMLLATYSGEDDVVFGVTVTGRPADMDGVERMIGIFLNTLPARVKLNRDDRVLDWLHALQDKQAELRGYEYTPLVRIREWSDLPAGAPLFEAIIVFENFPSLPHVHSDPTGLDVQHDLSVGRTSFPITLMVTPGDRLSLRLLYDRRRFDAASIEGLAEHFHRLLVEFTGDLDRSLRELADVETTTVVASTAAATSPAGFRLPAGTAPNERLQSVDRVLRDLGISASPEVASLLVEPRWGSVVADCLEDALTSGRAGATSAGRLEATVLDRWGRCVPAEVPGELSFRVTGTLLMTCGSPLAAMRTSSGQLVCLGSKADQHKVHGYRIDPAVVGAALRAHPSVEDAVAVIQTDANGTKQLRAWCQMATDVRYDWDALLHDLKRQLPDYLIPAEISEVDHLPRTESGRVAFDEIPTVSTNRSTPSPEDAASDFTIQDAILDIWKELLGVEDVDAADNFFAMGGNSLQIVGLVTTIESRVGKRIGLADAFLNSTFGDLVRCVQSGPNAEPSNAAIQNR